MREKLKRRLREREPLDHRSLMALRDASGTFQRNTAAEEEMFKSETAFSAGNVSP